MEENQELEKNTHAESSFTFSGELTKKKMVSYFPAMLVTYLSTLLLITVDGLVVSNMCGASALSSVNIFQPATIFIGIISMLVSAGAATRLSSVMGKIDITQLLQTRATLKIIMIVAAIFVTIIQIPIVYIIIDSYHLSPEMNSLVWNYAIGIMIASPFGFISTIGVLQLQIIGKMRVLMGLAALEGGVNLVLDLLFVGPMNMGVAGAGYGTLAANVVRCTTTLIYLIKKTDVFYCGQEKASMREVWAIIQRGIPDAAHSLMNAIQNYAIMYIILSSFGEIGGAIKGVCSFTVSIATVFINSIVGSVRPMCGLFSGAENHKGLGVLMWQGIFVSIILTGGFLAVVELFPSLFYSLHGVTDIPNGGIMSLRLYASYFVFLGINSLFRLYFSNRKIIKFTTTVTIIGSGSLLLFAVIFSNTLPPVYLWLSYLASETIIIIANVIRYIMVIKNDKNSRAENEIDLYLTITPKEAIEASRHIRSYASEHNINRKHAFRAALCVEEMTAYAKNTHKSDTVDIQVMIRFFPDKAILMIIDDGKCIYLDNEKANQKIVTSNYGLLKKLSDTVEYQYVLDLNYTVCKYA
mgnify:CR=1 FL=1